MSRENPTWNRFEAPELRRLRAMKALELRIGGMKLKDIAVQLNCGQRTVYNLIEWARKEGLCDDYESTMLHRLVPKAIKVYEAQLDSNDPFVAKDVIDKLIKLGDRYQSRQQAKEELGLTAYLAARKDRVLPKNGRQAGPTVEVIDSEVITDGNSTIRSNGPRQLTGPSNVDDDDQRFGLELDRLDSISGTKPITDE